LGADSDCVDKALVVTVSYDERANIPPLSIIDWRADSAGNLENAFSVAAAISQA
jgi:hypothetical protein